MYNFTHCDDSFSVVCLFHLFLPLCTVMCEFWWDAKHILYVFHILCLPSQNPRILDWAVPNYRFENTHFHLQHTQRSSLKKQWVTQWAGKWMMLFWFPASALLLLQKLWLLDSVLWLCPPQLWSINTALTAAHHNAESCWWWHCSVWYSPPPPHFFSTPRI